MIYDLEDFPALNFVFKKLKLIDQRTDLLCLDELPIRGIMVDTVRKVDSAGRLSKKIDGLGIYFARTSIEPHVDGCVYGEQMFCWNNQSGDIALIDKIDCTYIMKTRVKNTLSLESKKQLKVVYQSENLKKVLLEAVNKLS